MPGRKAPIKTPVSLRRCEDGVIVLLDCDRREVDFGNWSVLSEIAEAINNRERVRELEGAIETLVIDEVISASRARELHGMKAEDQRAFWRRRFGEAVIAELKGE